MAFADAEQAVTTHVTGPSRWCSIEAIPAAMLGMILGMPVGLTRSGPLARRVDLIDERLHPPKPAPAITPARAAAGSSSSNESPAWERASRTATRKNWV